MLIYSASSCLPYLTWRLDILRFSACTFYLRAPERDRSFFESLTPFRALPLFLFLLFFFFPITRGKPGACQRAFKREFGASRAQSSLSRINFVDLQFEKKCRHRICIYSKEYFVHYYSTLFNCIILLYFVIISSIQFREFFRELSALERFKLICNKIVLFSFANVLDIRPEI